MNAHHYSEDDYEPLAIPLVNGTIVYLKTVGSCEIVEHIYSDWNPLLFTLKSNSTDCPSQAISNPPNMLITPTAEENQGGSYIYSLVLLANTCNYDCITVFADNSLALFCNTGSLSSGSVAGISVALIIVVVGVGVSSCVGGAILHVFYEQVILY